MFRAIIKQRNALDMPQVADIGIISANISEDLSQKATSTIDVDKVPSNINIGDVLGIYNTKGIFTYWGIINAIEDTKITLSQFNALYNDNHLITPQTTANQKSFFNTKSVSDVLSFVLRSKEIGHYSIANNMLATLQPQYTGLNDIDVANQFKGIKHTIVDDYATLEGEKPYVPFPTESNVVNLEQYTYDIFNTYNRVIRPKIDMSIKSESVLPDGYTKLNYIASSGRQYINTLIKKAYVKVDCNVFMIQVQEGRKYYCGKNKNSSNYLTPIMTGANITRFGYGYRGTFTNSNTAMLVNTDYHIVSTLFRGNQSLVVNGTQIASTTNANTMDDSIDFYLFGYNNSGSFVASPHMAIRDFKMYDENNTLLRDYIPAKRTLDGEVGLYDMVSDTFFTNAGSGTFDYQDDDTNSLNLVIFNPRGSIEYEEGKTWDYSQKVLFDTYDYISNLKILKRVEDCNTVSVYSSDGITMRGTYTLLSDGTPQLITDGTFYPTRIGCNKTKIVNDSDNRVIDVALKNLPILQYNHQITFDINLDGEFGFYDFNMAQPIKFYSTDFNYTFDSILTARKYNIEQNSDIIHNASFTLGKVRTSLTSKLNKG